ncbi:MAG: hypothetical protein AAF492_28530, partial [Verrucomicrobiota bacterium]
LSAQTDEERWAAFAFLMEHMTADNARAINAFIQSLSPSSLLYRRFHERWGELAGQDAVEYGDPALALKGWARKEPEAAVNYYNAMVEASDGSDTHFLTQIGKELVRGLAEADPLLASDVLEAIAESGITDDELRSLIRQVGHHLWKDVDPADAVAWADALPLGLLRDVGRDVIARMLAGQNPQAALEWIQRIAELRDGEFRPDDVLGRVPTERVPIDAMARALTDLDPIAALAWVDSLSNELWEKGGGYYNVFHQWARNDFDAALAHLKEMADFYGRDEAFKALSASVIHTNPDLAVRLANAIEGRPGLRHRTIKETFNQWMYRSPMDTVLDYVRGMSADRGRDDAYAGIASNLSRNDPFVNRQR